MSRIAAVQMASGPNSNANLLEAERLIKLAAEAGAKLVVLPENFALMGMHEHDKVKIREADGEGHLQDFLAEQAMRNGVWLVGGTIPLSTHDPDKVAAASLLYDAQGKRVARYDKIHLFDVLITENDERYNESQTIEPGERTVVVDTPFGKLGMAVCYDLRFPGLFRSLVDQGAEIITIPSAFTAITGKAHWEVLLRARAIENQCYVVAAAQGGYHANGRETYGNSMLIDPWGQVVERLARGSGVVVGEINLERLRDIRRSFPVLEHRKIRCVLP
ncbi:MAG: carbon-nitrogen hydrolase family protein [Gammaproteobacteria bacterium]|nr:carbon-nitrogen hydrolase family protein [Gammaproteobacteria bacterium]